METATLGNIRYGLGGLVKEDIKGDDEEATCKQDFALKIGNGSTYQENVDIKPSSPTQNDLISCSKQVPSITTGMERSSMEPDSMASSSSRKEQDDQLESVRAEMGEVREENQRLKMYLDRVMKEYQTLQMQFHGIAQQETKKSTTTTNHASNNDHQETDEAELVSLTLGSFSSNLKKDIEKNKTCSDVKEPTDHDQQVKEGLSLGLDWKFEASKTNATELPLSNPSPLSSSEEPKEEAGETCPPSKSLKTTRSSDDEVSQQNPVKKARVSVRARCDTPTMHDGCQWRKYGQKIAKGNPCPRAYYRCTIAPSCPVRKQVQRCADDMSILITTYEGTHNHPLPMSATAMASTTSAAASMLLSGSTTSRSGGLNPSNTTTSADLHGFNIYISDNTKFKQFYLPNSSLTSSHPTITLDLTSNPSSASSLFNKFSSNYPPMYSSSTNLNFCSSDSNTMSWSNNGFLSYGSSQPYNNRNNQIGNLSSHGRQTRQNNLYQNYMHKNVSHAGLVLPHHHQQGLPDTSTLDAATKAITADPSFQSALAAALSSIIGCGGGTQGNQVGGGDLSTNAVKKLKWGEQFSVNNTQTYMQTTSKGNGCASSYLNDTTSSSNSQPGNSTFLSSPPSLPFSNSKNASPSSGDRDQNTE
ncbi:hypothetical protein FNV43_RR20531 [Rhamnella rubrinervis]|uniref:WRKY domain-containing protein n=1 Tax=Rhamnella rubrinervis TaxID=2594499 RepID=A0A8K0E1L5_9ROSA|nr:hypothetical protein FNV43_RR20531 [Rhamnella rubrinervis]